VSQLVSEARKTARGSLMLIAGNALGTFIAGLGSIVLARVLGSGAYGAYTLSLTVANFLLFFTDPGMSAAITRFSARLTVEKRPGAAVHVIRLGLITRASLGALATVMGILFAPMLSSLLLNRPELETVVKIVAVSILPLAAYGAIGSALIGLSDVKNYSALYVVQQILRTVLRPLLVITGLGLLGAVIGHVAAVYVVCIAGLAVLYRVHLKDIKEVNSPNLKDMLVFGLPLFGSSIIGYISIIYKNIILAYYTSNIEIGNLTAAQNFVALLSVLTVPISQTLFPAFSRLDRKDIGKFYDYSVKYASLLLVPAALFLAVSSEDAVNIIYGLSYEKAAGLLTLLIFSQMYAGLNLSTQTLLNGVGETRTVFMASLLGFCVMAPLTYMLTLNLSVAGFAIATVISGAVSTAFLVLQAWRKLNVKPPLQLAKIYFLAVIALPPVALFRGLRLPGLITAVIIYIVILATLAPLIGVVDEEDIDNLRSIFKGIAPLTPVTDLILSYMEKVRDVKCRYL